MPCRNRRVVMVLCCAACLIPPSSYSAEVPTATAPEKMLFMGAPYQCAFLEEEHLFLMANSGGVYAFDTVSGEQRWHRYLVSSGGGQGVSFGKRQVLAWSDQGVFVLDAATGRETWWRRATQAGRMYSVSLSPDESRVLVCGDEGSLLFGLADRSQRALPATYGFQGWFNGGESFLFAQYESSGDNRVRKWKIMDADTGTATPCFEEHYSWEDPSPAFSGTGLLASLSTDDKGAGVLTLRDVRTGDTARTFSVMDGPSRFVMWINGGQRLFCLSADRREVRVIHPETGAAELVLPGGGHRFLPRPPFEDASGTVWVFSKDGANSIHAWKLASDATPQKMIDGSRLAPGNFYFDRTQPGTFSVMGMEEDRLWVYGIYSLEDMTRLAEWRCRVPKQVYGGFYVNRGRTHGAVSYTADDSGYYRPENRRFCLFALNREEPVRCGRGGVLAISPDAKYLAVQTDGQRACLYDTEADRAVAAYDTGEESDDQQRYMSASFSNDGKRLAVNTTEAVEITELSEGFPRKQLPHDQKLRYYTLPLRFSPDGLRLLVGGINRVWLYDTGSGALLRAFEETERFADRYSYRRGFFNSLAETAKDWAGLVTDRFKQGEMLEAFFADDGARIFTHTAGQIIRVWDTESGAMLRAIHTGLSEKRNGEGRINNQISVSPDSRTAFAFNSDGFAPGTLWSLEDGAPLRTYALPASTWMNATPGTNGDAVFVTCNGSLYRWPGVPAEFRAGGTAP